jgi:hypothetical protein
VGILTQDNNKDALDNNILLNTKVSIEKSHKKIRRPPQCQNCQLYGHTRNNCCHEPKCVKCGSNHPTKECSKDRHSPPKCALCTKEHTENFKGCPVYKATFKKIVPRVRPAKGSDSNAQSKTKYPEATKIQFHTWRIISPTLYQHLF